MQAVRSLHALIPPNVPLNTGSDELIKVWAGRSGMRLKEQFGSGADEPATPGWVTRPWATIWGPKKINDEWTSLQFDPLYDLGDVDLDGVNDITAGSWPFLICYLGGRRLDSLIDALVKALPNPLYVTRVGNIDGSGKSTIAVFTTPDAVGWNPDPGSITFVQPTKDVPHEKYYRTIPPGTDTPCVSSSAGVVLSERPSPALELSIVPNPLHGEMRLHWTAPDERSEPVLSISDERGREIERKVLPAGSKQAIWATAGVPKGTYLVLLRVGARTATARVIVE